MIFKRLLSIVLIVVFSGSTAQAGMSNIQRGRLEALMDYLAHKFINNYFFLKNYASRSDILRANIKATQTRPFIGVGFSASPYGQSIRAPEISGVNPAGSSASIEKLLSEMAKEDLTPQERVGLFYDFFIDPIRQASLEKRVVAAIKARKTPEKGNDLRKATTPPKRPESSRYEWTESNIPMTVQQIALLIRDIPQQEQRDSLDAIITIIYNSNLLPGSNKKEVESYLIEVANCEVQLNPPKID